MYRRHARNTESDEAASIPSQSFQPENYHRPVTDGANHLTIDHTQDPQIPQAFRVCFQTLFESRQAKLIRKDVIGVQESDTSPRALTPFFKES